MRDFSDSLIKEYILESLNKNFDFITAFKDNVDLNTYKDQHKEFLTHLPLTKYGNIYGNPYGLDSEVYIDIDALYNAWGKLVQAVDFGLIPKTKPNKDFTGNLLSSKGTYGNIKDFKDYIASIENDPNITKDIIDAMKRFADDMLRLWVAEFKGQGKHGSKVITKYEYLKDKAEAEAREAKNKSLKERQIEVSKLFVSLVNDESFKQKVVSKVKEYDAKYIPGLIELTDVFNKLQYTTEPEQQNRYDHYFTGYANLSVFTEEIYKAPFEDRVEIDIEPTYTQSIVSYGPHIDSLGVKINLLKNYTQKTYEHIPSLISIKFEPEKTPSRQLPLTEYIFKVIDDQTIEINNNVVSEAIKLFFDMLDSELERCYTKALTCETNKDEILKKLNVVFNRDEIIKRLQNAVNAGKPYTQEFIDVIKLVGNVAKGHAAAEAASWSNYRYDDGDSGAAAYYGHLEKTGVLIPYFKEISFTYTTSSYKRDIITYDKETEYNDPDIDDKLHAVANDICDDVKSIRDLDIEPTI